MMAAGHGRRWITRLQRYQPDCVGSRCARRLTPGSDHLSILRPTKPRSAGRSVTAASIVVSTPIAIAIDTPRMIDVFISQQAEHRDHDRGAGEQHRATGGVDRAHDAALGVEPGVEVLAVAGDDEQRVVDADTDADHRHRGGGEVGHVDEVADDEDQRDAGADAEQRGADRQPHREHRPERDQQDDHGGEQPDRLAGAADRVGGEHVAAVLDRQPLDVDLVSVGLDLLAGVEEVLRRPVGEVQLGVRDVVAADLALARRGCRG